MTIAVRRLGPADAAAYHAIRLDGLQREPEAFDRSYEDERETPIERVAEGLVRNTVFGAEDDGGELAGVAGLSVRPAARLAHKAVLFGMYVRPAARRQGIAGALIDAIVAAARGQVEEIQLSVVTTNVAAVALYARAGFRSYGLERRALKIGEVFLDEHLMALNLAGEGQGVVAPRGGFHGPVKRSITIAGHQTSISLEPAFWQALETAAVAWRLPLSALVAAIDAERIIEDDPPNLASALRTWLLDIN
jgi:RimJ/RimL family protein N-acetyltransferase